MIRLATKSCALALAIFLTPLCSWAISLSPTYSYTVEDAVTGDNYIAPAADGSGGGWYVDPGADEHDNDLLRERPLGTQDFGEYEDQWTHPGKYYSYLDIVTAQWGYDTQSEFLFFRQNLYGNWDMDDAADERDYEVFGSGSLYNIIIGQDPGGEANGSILLRTPGDNKDTWTGSAGMFEPDGAQGFLDNNTEESPDVGGSGITNTNEDGDDVIDGYEYQPILTDGYIGDSNNPQVLFSRVTGATKTDDSMPYVEIAFDYGTWNEYAFGLSLPTISPQDITLLVFEANRGIKDNANYLWNDKYTIGEEGSPYHIMDENGDYITQLGNVYELDRVHWVNEPVPEPGTVLLMGTGLAGIAAYRRKKKTA